MTRRQKAIFWPPASQLYSPVSALPACCTTSCHLQPLASKHTLELVPSFFPSLNHVTYVFGWATPQLSMALAPASACTSLRTSCSLVNTALGSGDTHRTLSQGWSSVHSLDHQTLILQATPALDQAVSAVQLLLILLANYCA